MEFPVMYILLCKHGGPDVWRSLRLYNSVQLIYRNNKPRCIFKKSVHDLIIAILTTEFIHWILMNES